MGTGQTHPGSRSAASCLVNATVSDWFKEMPGQNLSIKQEAASSQLDVKTARQTLEQVSF